MLNGPTRVAADHKTKIRWLILAMLFAITAINYADRATIAIAGPVVSKDLGLNAAPVTAISYLLIVGEIKRMVLVQPKQLVAAVRASLPGANAKSRPSPTR
jgi:ABC-type enterochelin transport system permease subunit